MISPLPMVSPDSSPQRISLSPYAETLEVPNLIDIQLESFHWFKNEGMQSLLQEVSPIRDYTGSRLELYLKGYEFKEPKHSLEECRQRDLTYAAPLHLNVLLAGKEKPEPVEQQLFIGELPLMTPWGTFIVNGTERVVVSQLLRSPGVYFAVEEDPATGRLFGKAKLIPDRGGWLELETSSRDVLYIKLDNKRRVAITALFQALGYDKEQLLNLFSKEDGAAEHAYIPTTLNTADADYAKTFKEPSGITDQEKALKYLYSKLRPGDPISLENARTLVDNLFHNPRRYDLGKMGRYRLNCRLGFYEAQTRDITKLLSRLPQLSPQLREEIVRHAQRNSDEVIAPLKELQQQLPRIKRESRAKTELTASLTQALSRLEEQALTADDMVEIVRRLILLNNGQETTDDIDHLGNRRVRTVGELLLNQFRLGFLRLERVIRDRMSIFDPKIATPVALINIRPIQGVIREFFAGSQLSQFMDQTNPLAELTHKRRLSAMGPGGLSRERAGFEVRDVHHSHYGRICPIETPEGPNIGLIGSLATYARINPLGFIETPYWRVIKELLSNDPALVGRTLRQGVTTAAGEAIAEAGTEVSQELGARLAQLPPQLLKVVPYVSTTIQYLTADKEEEYYIAQANTKLNNRQELVGEHIEARQGMRYLRESAEGVDFIDVSPKQIVSVATSLIPFLEHDDANRALMGSNMQRQAVPLLRAQAPIVGTGMERWIARDSGQLLFARRGGEVASATNTEVSVKGEGGEIDRYPLIKFTRTNQGTCINQRPVVNTGQRIRQGQLLADSSATDHGELALGQNLLVAFMFWEGYNFEDAIVINEKLAKEDLLTSVHIERFEIDARETKLGEEEITRDIPNIGEESLRELDEMGVIRVGAYVAPGDILVGKITPKGETELTAEEKLLRAIFGEKAQDVKDTSLRAPHGEGGRVIGVKVFSRDNHPELPPGVIKTVRVWIAQKRKVSVGDKMAGRHGNKGVVSRILPQEDMPYLPDGRPVDIILNPIGVPSRMNLGQILETHLGWAAHTLNFKALCPVFQGANSLAIEDSLAQTWLVQQAGAVRWDGDRATVNLEQAQKWLQSKGYSEEHVFDIQPGGKARLVCLSLWLEEQGIDPRSMSAAEVEQEVQRQMAERNACPPILGKVVLRDGRSGEPFDQPITVGNIYMMKLIHLVEDKVHARSIGPYSLITQQPLGGKAQFGGQRFGEMEVWALEAYGAAHTLQELLTVKSDDVPGRAKTYEALVKGEDILQPGVPESFKVLSQELKSLGLAVEIMTEAEE